MTRPDFDLDNAIHGAFSEALLDAIIAIDADGIIIEFNSLAETLFGFSRDFALQKPLLSLITPPSQLEQYRALIPTFDIESGGMKHQRIQTIARRADTHDFPVEMTIAPTITNGQRVALFFVRDITDRILNEQNLTWTKARMQRTIENLEGGVLVEDETRHIELVNAQFCQMFHIPVEPEMLIGVDCSQSAEETKDLFSDPVAFVSRIEFLLQKRELVLGDTLHLKDGRVLRRDYIPTYNGQHYAGHLWHYHDITVEYQVRQRWEQLSKLDALHKEIIQVFLHSDDLNAALDKTLTFAGQLMDVTRFCVFRFRPNEQIADNTHEWCGQGITPDRENMQGVPIQLIAPSFFSYLQQHGLIAAEKAEDLPEDMRHIMKMRNILSVLIVPVYSGDRLEGYISCHEHRRVRAWLPEEVTTLRMIAETYARALEREQARQMLIDARDTALRTAAMKGQFVANMSHEIRTPMTGVIGMLDLLRETSLDEDQREFAEEAFQSAYRLMGVINDILDFSKLESGRVALQSETLDLRAIATEVRSILTPQIGSKPVCFELDIASDVPRLVLGDSTRMRQILINLAGNAVKFTEKGQVAVRIRLLGKQADMNWLRFEVSDTGIGIAPEHQAQIFESFIQVDGTTTRKYGGTGLGLAISRQFVELMGGSMGVESAPDRGTTFHFSLSMPALAENDEIAFFDFTPLRALVIDDDPLARHVLGQRLQNLGVQVTMLTEYGDLNALLTMLDDGKTALDIAFVRQPKGDETGIDPLYEALRRGNLRSIASIVDERPATGRLESGGMVTRLLRPIQQSELYNVLVQTLQLPTPVIETPAPEPESRKWHILLAEDYSQNVALVRRGLEDLDIEVDDVGDGAAALVQLTQKSYDLVLMDMHMPIMDGMEATKSIRASSAAYRNIPIVALTANALQDQQEHYLEIGINAIITKPYLLKHLRTTVMYWLELVSAGTPMLSEDA